MVAVKMQGWPRLSRSCFMYICLYIYIMYTHTHIQHIYIYMYILLHAKNDVHRLITHKTGHMKVVKRKYHQMYYLYLVWMLIIINVI